MSTEGCVLPEPSSVFVTDTSGRRHPGSVHMSAKCADMSGRGPAKLYLIHSTNEHRQQHIQLLLASM
jgi:hypothetical protein